MSAAEDVARGLTKAQRDMVLTDDKWFSRQWKGYWTALSSATGKRLYVLGLVDEPEAMTKPTALGLAVRQHLLDKGGEVE